MASEGIGPLPQEELASSLETEELRDIVESLSLEQLRHLVISAAHSHCDTLEAVRVEETRFAGQAHHAIQVVSAAEHADAASVVSASTTSINVRQHCPHSAL